MKAIWTLVTGSRKLQMFLLMYVTSTVFYLWVGNVEFPDWMDFMVWMFGIYCGGNVGEHVSKNITTKK
jgi:uncharacterized membrane protein YfcA